jgi:D-serine deaminase-like pyridoxal phosphate-dependent protein
MRDNKISEWYHIKNINEIDSPALVIYPDRVKENIHILLS